MKRLVLFGIVIFLVIIGGFLVVDKVWLHRIFKVNIAPGSCLILEEKYCKTGEIRYVDDSPIGILYKVKKNTPIFSPMTESYSVTKANNSDKELFAVGNNSFEEKNVKKDGYKIWFEGILLKNIKTETGNKIYKKNIIGYTSNSSKNKIIEVIFIPTKSFLDDFDEIQTINNTEEILKIFNNSKK